MRRRCSCTRDQPWRLCGPRLMGAWPCSGRRPMSRSWTPRLAAPSCRLALASDRVSAACSLLCKLASSIMCTKQNTRGSPAAHINIQAHGPYHVQAARSRAPIRAAFWTDSAAGDLALATAAGLELYRWGRREAEEYAGGLAKHSDMESRAFTQGAVKLQSQQYCPA